MVIPAGSGLPTDVETYQNLAGGGLHIQAVTADAAAAEAGLADGSTDVVVVAPPDAEAQFRAGKQSIIGVQVNTVDPLRANYAGFLAANLANAVNQTIIRRAVEETEGYIAASDPSAPVIPPEVVAAPTKAEIQNTAPSEPQVLAYFGPAVLALILQHLAVTLVALALVRERTSGVIELFRVAPVNAWEVIAGKVLTYMLIGGLIAAATVALLVGVFQIPMLGSSGRPCRRHRPGAAGLARDRPSHRDHLRLGAPGGPAVTAAAPRVGLLQRLRARDLRVHRAGPGAGLHAPGHPRDPVDAGHHAARRDDPDLGVRGTRWPSPWSPWRGAGSACDGR